MSLLDSMLKNLAVESGLVEPEDTPTEITIVTDETVTELEEEVQSLAEEIKENNAELDQVLEASDAIVSVEAILTTRNQLLRNPQFAAGYTRTIQAFNLGGIQEAMEGYGFPRDVYADLVTDVTFEAEEGEGGAAQAEKDAKKNDGALKRFMTMLANACKMAKQLFVRFLDLFRTSAEKNKRSVEILEKAIAEREGAAKADKVSGNWADLTVNGKVDPSAALKLVEDGYTKHLSDAQKKANGVVTKVADILKRGTSSGFSGVIDSLLKSTGARNSDDVSAALVLNAFLSDFPSDFKYPLPGGREGVYAMTKKSSGAPSVTFSITKGSAESGDTTMPSLGDLTKLVGELKAYGKVIADMNKQIDESIKTSEALMNEAEAAAKLTGETAGLQAVVGATQAVLNISKIFLPRYNDLALKTAHSAYRFGMAALNSYPKKGAAKDDKKAEA